MNDEFIKPGRGLVVTPKVEIQLSNGTRLYFNDVASYARARDLTMGEAVFNIINVADENEVSRLLRASQ